MRKIILNWLFGTDNIEDYMNLLRMGVLHDKECLELIHEHQETIKTALWAINTIKKLTKICENHGIDVDEEIQHIELDEEG